MAGGIEARFDARELVRRTRRFRFLSVSVAVSLLVTAWTSRTALADVSQPLAGASPDFVQADATGATSMAAVASAAPTLGSPDIAPPRIDIGPRTSGLSSDPKVSGAPLAGNLPEVLSPTPSASFSGGVRLLGDSLPPDTNGAVGPNHVVGTVNYTLR